MQGRLIARADPPPSESFDVSAAFCADPATGELIMRAFRKVVGNADPLDLADPDAPTAFFVLRMDQMIARPLRRLDALRAGSPPPEEPAPARGEDSDPFRVWSTDAQGRRVTVVHGSDLRST